MHDLAPHPPASDWPRLQARARFLFEGDRKFRLQGVTYGPFRPQAEGGPQLPSPEKAARDLRLMRELGINVVRVYHPPPRWFLDLAQTERIRVLVTVPWHKRVLFLDDREALAAVRRKVQEAADANAGHPAMLGFFIDNEIPSDLVRWYGPARIEEFLNSLVRIVKACDPLALAAYANFPPTEYLRPDEADFYSYNVFLHQPQDLTKYLARLQNLAGDKPLVLSEFGMDTIRHSESEQAALLAGQVRTVFESGLAGTIIFAWTDEWFTDGLDVTDWAFGIVKADRTPKAAFRALQPLLSEPERPLYRRFESATKLPRVSVVVCSYNGARTLRDCLASLEELHYPDYEVILVDDGSTDGTPAIARDFPRVRNLRQENRGLGAARNAGIAAATGDVIAFTDADCMADPDWIYFLVRALQSGDFAAAGGPNLSPPAKGWVQATVAAAPGSPSHVLLTDTLAEHVPGCNMAFHKWALALIGGFDPEYHTAGDDVDVCWRLMELGCRIGFSPAAIVWHHRRFAISSYISQQVHYGEAEAMLRYKHLQHFGPTGSVLWQGNVYSQVRLSSIFLRPVIYHGIFGTGFLQSIYPRRASPWAGLFGSLEWLGLAVLVFLLAFPLPGLRLLTPLMLALPLLGALAYTMRARIEARHNGAPARLLLFYLSLLQPWRRAWARYYTWLRGKRTPRSVIATREIAPHPRVKWTTAGHLCFWSESGLERSQLLEHAILLLEEEGWKYALDTGWTDWDVHIFASRWWSLRLRTMTEIYPHGRRLTRTGNFLVASTFSRLIGGVLLALGIAGTLDRPQLMLPLAAGLLLCAAFWIMHGLRLRHRVAELVQVAAIRAGLHPVASERSGGP